MRGSALSIPAAAAATFVIAYAAAPGPGTADGEGLGTSGLSAASVYYSDCNEARAAGVAPIYRGQPGYRSEMDGDSDGIACEPYRRY